MIIIYFHDQKSSESISIDESKHKAVVVAPYIIITFKDLQKLIQPQSDSEQTELIERLENKPFWIWNIEEHISISNCRKEKKEKKECLRRMDR